MSEGEVGLLSTRRTACDPSAGQSRAMGEASMSAGHRALVVKVQKGGQIRNIRSETALPTC